MQSISLKLFIQDFIEISKKGYPQFFNDFKGNSWFRDAFQLLDKKIIYKILSKWKKQKLSQEIFLDFKKVLNYQIPRDNYIERLLLYQGQEEKELIYLLINFGLEIDSNVNNSIIEIEKKINRLENNLQFLKKLRAGKKIANYIEEAMDDEFDLKPLRSRIDMRKIKDLYNKNGSN